MREPSAAYDVAMGFDCSLHLVDEGSFARFTSRFLRGVLDTPAFDTVYEVDEMIATTKDLMTTEPPRGAKALGSVALMFASTETPHVSSRGFSLSLWDEKTMGTKPPPELMGSVEPHLRDIIAAYPACAGLVPDLFIENYMVGPFVTAKNVPALLAYVDRTLEALVPGDRRPYLPLRNLLRVAVERGLAYWEGTDLDVAQANESWLGLEIESGIARVPHGFTSTTPTLRAVAPHRLLVFERWRFHDIDTSMWPPASTTREPMQVTIAAPTPWNTLFLRVATDPDQRPYVFENLDGTRTIELPWEPGDAIAARDAVLIFPDRFASLRSRADHLPLVLRPSGLTTLDVPRATKADLACFATAFGDGTMLVIWDSVPYRWDGRTVTPLGGELEGPDGVQAVVTLAEGSVVGGFGRKLVRIDREGTQTTILPLDNVMMVGLGPDEVLIVVEGDHPESDLMKLYWPRTRELTHVEDEILGLAAPPPLVYYDAPRAQLVLAAPEHWHAVPWATLAALPRVPLDAYTERRRAVQR